MLEAVAAAVAISRGLRRPRAASSGSTTRTSRCVPTAARRAARRARRARARAGGLVEELRAVKDDDEIEAIRRATRDRRPDLRVAERRARARRPYRAGGRAARWSVHVQRAGRRGGGISADRRRRSARRAAARDPREVEIPRGTLVVVDFGCAVDGYYSDCTRTLATGEIESEARETYELVRSGAGGGLARSRSRGGGRARGRRRRTRADRGAGQGRALRPRRGSRRGPRGARGAAPRAHRQRPAASRATS